MFKFEFDESELVQNMQNNLKKNAKRFVSASQIKRELMHDIIKYAEVCESENNFEDAENLTYYLEVLAQASDDDSGPKSSEKNKVTDFSRKDQIFMRFLHGANGFARNSGEAEKTKRDIIIDFAKVISKLKTLKHFLSQMDTVSQTEHTVARYKYKQMCKEIRNILAKYVAPVREGKIIDEINGDVLSLEDFAATFHTTWDNLQHILEEGKPEVGSSSHSSKPLAPKSQKIDPKVFEMLEGEIDKLGSDKLKFLKKSVASMLSGHDKDLLKNLCEITSKKPLDVIKDLKQINSTVRRIKELKVDSQPDEMQRKTYGLLSKMVLPSVIFYTKSVVASDVLSLDSFCEFLSKFGSEVSIKNLNDILNAETAGDLESLASEISNIEINRASGMKVRTYKKAEDFVKNLKETGTMFPDSMYADDLGDIVVSDTSDTDLLEKEVLDFEDE